MKNLYALDGTKYHSVKEKKSKRTNKSTALSPLHENVRVVLALAAHILNWNDTEKISTAPVQGCHGNL